MTPRQAESFDMAKEGLRRLLAAGASNKEDAEELVTRIRRISTWGTRIEVDTMKVWPDNDPNAQPASTFFVNERVDLLVREAETFRNDYRRTNRRVVFNALYKPLPWARSQPDPNGKYVEPSDEVDTQKYCGVILTAIILACILLSTVVISRQNRQTR